MKVTTAVVLIIIAVVLFIIRPLLPSFSTAPIQEPTIPALALHPLSIDNLRTTVFPPQPINIESEINAGTKIVSYYSDNLKLTALMITPKGTLPAAGWPVIIVNHGYIPPSQYSTTRSYINTSNFFAANGFLVLKPDYRGHDRSRGGAARHFLLRSQYVVDVLNLLASLNSVPNADPNRVFMYGHSMGGDITLQILEITDKVKAATLWAPAVTAYPEHYLHFLNKLKPSSVLADQFHREYQSFLAAYPISQISSYENLEKISAPINLHHSTGDKSVPYDWGENLAAKLKGLNKPVNFYSYPNDNHDLAANFSKALSRDVTFFRSL